MRIAPTRHRSIKWALLGGLVVALVAPGAAAADTLTVTSSADSGLGSLRQAIADAADGDTILVGQRNIVLTSGDLLVPMGKGLTIVGAGAHLTSISGNHASGIFETYDSLKLRDLTLRDGNDAQGAAVDTMGSLTLIDTALIGNTSSAGGGAVYAFGQAVTIVRSLFAYNVAASSDGGALHLDGNYVATVTNSTFVGNAAGTTGGAINVMHNYVSPTTVALVNDTFVGNRAAPGVGKGPVLYVAPDQTVSYRNSLFVDNGDVCGHIADGHAVSNGNNMFDGLPSALCNLTEQDATVTVAEVTALASHGGPTDTVALLTGSPALDVAATPYCPGFDTRGVARPFGGGCDIGAVEHAPPAATTGAATAVTATSAAVGGSVDGHGLAPVVTRFEWGTTTAYGHMTPGTSSPATTGTVGESLDGLPAGTTIHYRLRATTFDGTATGADMTFTTGTETGTGAAVVPPPPATGTATGEPTCTVPRLRGLKVRRAKRELAAAHCQVETVRRVWSRRVKRRHVVRTRPGTGAEPAAGTPVRLRVSRGPRPAAT